jgi:hypothetical protein
MSFSFSVTKKVAQLYLFVATVYDSDQMAEFTACTY